MNRSLLASSTVYCSDVVQHLKETIPIEQFQRYAGDHVDRKEVRTSAMSNCRRIEPAADWYQDPVARTDQ